jgi:hypothetical protein
MSQRKTIENRLENFAFLVQNSNLLGKILNSQIFDYQAKIEGARIYSLVHQCLGYKKMPFGSL